MQVGARKVTRKSCPTRSSGVILARSAAALVSGCCFAGSVAALTGLDAGKNEPAISASNIRAIRVLQVWFHLGCRRLAVDTGGVTVYSTTLE